LIFDQESSHGFGRKEDGKKAVAFCQRKSFFLLHPKELPGYQGCRPWLKFEQVLSTLCLASRLCPQWYKTLLGV
jgi:hypothetical protein